MVSVDHHHYEVIENVRNGWNEEAFLKRYSDILNKFDYIVGDWGYEQLRLRGFYENHNPKSTFDTKINTLVDYIVEYCSFGCAYFVLKKIDSK
ncbi:YutD family protein [Sporolactobacillus kofuensis]|uniref:YutD family protein n=1 Tax=Sporolactobacillus kofuensis TaxID=269672 RepID=A0ABW1WGU9_9BACL|nr:YutD family protein [Sporolactobacillus kofuensis]MCO7176047.1 YutD family protein [Sporolactobacillus kofuensis]